MSIKTPKEAVMKPSSEKSAAKEKKVRRMTWIGLLINIFLSGLKIAAGFLGKSQAVLADGIHSLTDLTTDIAVIAGSYFWAKPPDETHPYGHQRIETTVSLLIGAILLLAGAGIGWEAFATLQEKGSTPPGWIALSAAAVSIVCKEVLYRWTANAGKRVKSLSLSANAWHHRLDAISSIPVLFSVAVAMIWPQWNFIDNVAAVFVSMLIIYASLKILWPGFMELMDGGASRDVCEEIKHIALQNDAVVQAHKIRTRYTGSSLQVDLHVVVDGEMTVLEGHGVADDVERRILEEGPDVVDVIVHIEPPGSMVPDDDCDV